MLFRNSFPFGGIPSRSFLTRSSHDLISSFWLSRKIYKTNYYQLFPDPAQCGKPTALGTVVSHTEKKNLASWKLFQDYLPLYTDLVNMAKFPLLGEDQLVLLDTVKTGSTTNLLYATADLSFFFGTIFSSLQTTSFIYTQRFGKYL